MYRGFSRIASSDTKCYVLEILTNTNRRIWRNWGRLSGRTEREREEDVRKKKNSGISRRERIDLEFEI